MDRAGHLIDSGNLSGAVTALGDVLGWAESLYGAGDEDVLLVRCELGRTLDRLGRHYEAVDVLGPGVVLARELGPDATSARTDLIDGLVAALEASGRGAETPALHRERGDVVAAAASAGSPDARFAPSEDDLELTGDGAPGPVGGAGVGDAGTGGAGIGDAAEGGVGAAGGIEDGALGAPPVGGDASAEAAPVAPPAGYAGLPDGEAPADPTADVDGATREGEASAGPTSGVDGATREGEAPANLTADVGTASGPDEAQALAIDLRAAIEQPGVDVPTAQELVRRAESTETRQLLPDALLVAAAAHAAASDTDGAVAAHARRAEAVAALDGPTSSTALRAAVRHVSALVEAGRLDDALDANMFLGRDARRFRGDDLELADLTTARSADLLAAKGRFFEARQVFAELVDLRIRRPELGPESEQTLDARHRLAWATLEVDPAEALTLFEDLQSDMARALPDDHPLHAQSAEGADEARSDLAAKEAGGSTGE
ncbi:putative Fe-S oxidoreductase [Actinomycetales bacterium JB111]|nr:putative Fe-S oxidoreductase [Actinomycetales bacterium JB111]